MPASKDTRTSSLSDAAGVSARRPGLTRRAFLRAGASAGGGLLISVTWWSCAPAAKRGARAAPAPVFEMNAFVEIGTDGIVGISAPVPEIGQGVRTALPMIVADELDVAWEDVRVLQAPADRRYGAMAVGGSNSVAAYWAPLREAGAVARAMLVEAAARRWQVDSAECDTEAGRVIHPAGKLRIPYSEIAAEAARQPVPAGVKLKDPESFRIIGRPVPRVDLVPIVTGSAEFGLDVRVPGMLHAVVERSPIQGGKVASFDASAALHVPGVREVFEVMPLTPPGLLYGAVRSGVAVVAESTWAAIRGRDAVKIEWIAGSNAEESTASHRERMRARAGGPPETVLRAVGDVPGALRQAVRTFEADYETPLLAHACMEPIGFTADVREDRCEVAGSVQDPRTLQRLLAALLHLDPSQVKVRPTLEGGGFGRRLAIDYGVEAALVSRKSGAPVKVTWTREDDIRQDYFRTPSHHRMRAGVDGSGRLVAWSHHFLTSPLRRHIAGADTDYPELYDVEGAADFPYAVPAVFVGYTPVDLGLQLGSWRSVSHSFNVFAVACFLDEIAAALGRDPVDMLAGLLGEPREVAIRLPLPGRRGRMVWDTGRALRVLETVAEKSGWRSSAAGVGRGVALSRFKETYTAHVAEVSAGKDGRVRVERVVTAVDCGLVVNPDGVEAQVEGAVMDATASVFKWKVTAERGRVVESNFHDYPLLGIDEAPRVEVHIVDSGEPPSGMGEPPYPAALAAIANAVAAATGRRVRRLPAGRDIALA